MPSGDGRAREVAPGSSGQRGAPAKSRRGASDPALRVLALQRKLGNAGVARLVQGARQGSVGVTGGRRVLQRFAGDEHEELGNTLHTNIELGHGVTLTWGQLLAIAGDEVGTIEELLADPETEAGRHRLGASMINAELTSPVPAALKPTAAEQEEHNKEYVRLAFENEDHFPDSGKAIAAWTRHHSAAIDRALAAGFFNNPKWMNGAYAYEAFGQHFLTDCYSGSHLRTPRTQIVDWYLNWANTAADKLVAGLSDSLIDKLTTEASPQTLVPDRIIRGRVSDRVRPKIAGAVTSAFGDMAKFRRLLGLGVAGAISGTIHDKEGAAGVLVSSDDHRDPWLAYGDGKLKKSPISFAQAAKAVAAAKADVDLAYRIGEEEGAKVIRGSQADVLRATMTAALRARAAIGPPFKSVSSFIPRPVEERGGATSNTALPEWHWGRMSWKFVDVLDDYIKAAVGSKLLEGVRTSKDINDVETDTVWGSGTVIKLHPRRALEEIVRDFMLFPIETVGGLIGEPAYAPSPTPAGSKTPPIPAQEPGEEPIPDPSVPWPYGTPMGY